MIRFTFVGQYFGILSVATAARADERTEDECKKLHPEITSSVDTEYCTSDLDGSEMAMDEGVKKLRQLLRLCCTNLTGFPPRIQSVRLGV